MTHIPDSELIVPEIEPGIYRHYKGNEYKVLGVGLDTETHEPFVIYKPLYESKVSFWIRPYDMFIESILVNGKNIKRFEKIG